MESVSSFHAFLDDIRLTDAQHQDASAGHAQLREHILGDARLRPHMISTFLHGSYRRATAVRPLDGGRLDVDVAVVTDFPASTVSPAEVLNRFKPLFAKHYEDQWSARGRSLRVQRTHVDLDIVVFAAPTRLDGLGDEGGAGTLAGSGAPSAGERAAWQSDPLLVSNREASRWEPTHPLAQLAWTRTKNASCNGHYLAVVRTIQWWRRLHLPRSRAPGSYPLEHLIGDCCPDGIRSVPEGVALTFAAIANKYAWHARSLQTPVLADHGVPQHNVLAHVPATDFAALVTAAGKAAQSARRALDSKNAAASNRLWRDLLGENFPVPHHP